MNAPKQIITGPIIRFASCAVLFLFLRIASAQIAPLMDSSGRQSNEGVYVRDSAVAVEKLALADRLEHLQEWSKSADVYQELLDQFSDRVAPSGRDQDNHVDRYTSVANIVQDKLAHWPVDGLAIYRGRYESEAASLLQQAGDDPADLHKVVSQYFVTDSAKTAAFHLIDLDMENGDFSAAAWLGDRLLASYPGIDADRPMLLYRTAIAYRLAGDAADAQARADDLTKSFAAAQGVVQGKQIALADSLQQLLKAPPQSGENIAPDSWPMVFGSIDRARVPNVTGFGGAKLFNVPLTKENLRNINNTTPQQQGLVQAITAAREAGMMTGVMPVVDRGELFFQDNTRIYALNLDSGLPLAGWASTWDGDRNGRYVITAWPTPRNTLQTVALTDDSVLAIMGQIDLMTLSANMNFSQRDTRLVCLDRHNGKEKWVVRPQQFSSATLQQLELTGTPLVVGDNVYLTAHGTGGIQFQDCYLLCLDLAGHLKWSSYIVSANAGAAIFDGDPNDLSTATPQLAYSGGRVYVLSNLGAMAAVDAYDGTIAWLNLYPRDSNNDAVRQLGAFRGWNRSQNQVSTERPWTTSPAIISQGRLFVLPTDGQALMIYDAASGAEIKRIKLSHIGNASTLLAVVNDRLILCGPGTDGQEDQTRVICLNWQNYDLKKFSESDSSMLIWRTPFPVGLRGRGFVTADAVYIPTQKKLFRLNLKNGKTEAQYPDGDRVWDSTESSGNILVTQDHLIVAGPQWVNVYTDLNLAMSKLDKEVAAAPDDPNVRLRYAEIMFVAGKTDVAVAKLNEAIKVIGGLQNSGANPARNRIFTNALTFAETLRHRTEDNPAADASAGSEDITTINGLYDRAGSAANDPQQQVNYRISRSEFALHVHDATTELKLLQEILSEPTWRALAVARKDSIGPTQAGNVAEEMIDDLKRNAPDVYGPVQAEAQAAFTAAETTADPAKLLAVAQTYPNSDVAPQAMLKAADAYESVGNPRQAVQILRQHYLKYPNAADAGVVLESMARNYLATPNHVDVALARLMQGVKRSTGAKLSRPLVLPDGTVIKDVSFEQAADALRRYIEQGTARSLPDLSIPPPAALGQNVKAFIRQPEPVALHVDAIVSPIKDFGRNDRLVTFSVGAISVYAPGKNDALFTSHIFKDAPMNCAWIGDNLLIVSPSKIALIKGDGSSALWETELKSIPVVEVATHDQTADADNGADQQQNAPNVAIGGRVIINGQVVIIQDGRRFVLHGPGRFRMGLAGNPVNPAAIVANAGAEQIIKITLLADRAILATAGGRVICIDLADGKTLWQVRPSDRQVDRLLATDDFVVAQTSDGSSFRVIAFDTSSGQTVCHREFSNDNGGLVNLALASDGKLIYLLPDHLECFDLFEPADRPAFQVQVKGNDPNGVFSVAIAPDQLLLTEGRIVALSDEGRFFRTYSLETGKSMQANGAEGTDDMHGLQTRSNDGQVSLATVGSQLYAIGQKSLMAYNLDHVADNWSENDPGDFVRQQYLVSKDYLVLIGPKITNDNRRVVARLASTSLFIHAYSRALINGGRESGVLAYEYPLNNPTGISDFQGVDGGIYYLSGDHKLYFLKGARP